jgi:hypothetical protein
LNLRNTPTTNVAFWMMMKCISMAITKVTKRLKKHRLHIKTLGILSSEKSRKHRHELFNVNPHVSDLWKMLVKIVIIPIAMY